MKAEKESAIRLNKPVLDPIGDVTSGEAHHYLGDAELHALQKQAQAEIDAFKEETNVEASDAVLEAGPGNGSGAGGNGRTRAAGGRGKG